MVPAQEVPDPVVLEFRRRRDRQWLVPVFGFPFVLAGTVGGVVLGVHLAKALGWSEQGMAMACVAVPFIGFFVAAMRFSRRNFRCPACSTSLQFSGAGGLRYFRPGATCPSCERRLT